MVVIIPNMNFTPGGVHVLEGHSEIIATKLQHASMGGMELLLLLLPVLLIGGMLYLLVITLRDAAMRLKGTEQVVWMCVIILTMPIGPIIYLLVKPSNK